MITTQSDKTYTRNPDLVSANLGQELALLDLARGTYLGFNTTAAHLWRLLADPLTFAQICRGMQAEFDVESAVCEAEVAPLLDELLTAGLIREHEPVA